VPRKRSEHSVHRIFVTVLGGVAEVVDETIPTVRKLRTIQRIEVEIIDFDNLNSGDRDLEYLSPEAKAFVVKHRQERDPKSPKP
jgi:hypothetical protein